VLPALPPAGNARTIMTEKNIARSDMSEERTRLLQRVEERLARLEAGVHEGVLHWKKFHLHKALDALSGDHSTANLHLDEFDREALAKEYPEMEADRLPSIEEMRSRFSTISGGMV
jgi:hypothetical protein